MSDHRIQNFSNASIHVHLKSVSEGAIINYLRTFLCMKTSNHIAICLVKHTYFIHFQAFVDKQSKNILCAWIKTHPQPHTAFHTHNCYEFLYFFLIIVTLIYEKLGCLIKKLNLLVLWKFFKRFFCYFCCFLIGLS